MRNGLRVVLGDYDRERLALACAALEARGLSTVACHDGPAVLEACLGDPPDVVALEVFLPRTHGFDVLKSLKEGARTAGVRVLVLVDEKDDYGAHRARLCGADAILRRPFEWGGFADAVQAVHAAAAPSGSGNPGDSGDAALGQVLDALAGRARVENPLIHHISDPLTGLFNRSYMDIKIAEEFKKARRFGFPLTCIHIGIDDRGVLGGDSAPDDVRRTLNEIAGLLLCESRDIDHIARWQDRDFLLLLPHTDIAGATTMAKRILTSIEARGFEIGGEQVALTASAGIAAFGGRETETAEGLPERAREALAISRQWGGNRCTVWEADPEESRR